MGSDGTGSSGCSDLLVEQRRIWLRCRDAEGRHRVGLNATIAGRSTGRKSGQARLLGRHQREHVGEDDDEEDGAWNEGSLCVLPEAWFDS